MAGAAPPSGSGQPDNSSAILWGVAAVFAALGVLWYIFKDQLVIFYLTLKLYEVNLLNIVTFGHMGPVRDAILSALSKPDAIKFPDLVQLGRGVGSWIRVPLALIMFALAYIVYTSNTVRMYKRTYSMNELAKLEKVNWPQISPVLHLDLIKTDIDKGPWAMAMTPMQFCKRYRLLEEVRPQRREGMQRKNWDRIDVLLKKGEANKLFSLQLGQLWSGTNKLPPHTRALFAIFAARINADSAAAANLIKQLNESCTTGVLNTAGVNELLKKHENTKLVQQIVQSHAYVSTVMAAMLEGARDDGVQASADFLWLKPIDRKLWYTLNSVGRQTPFVEVAGIFAHWIAEKVAGRKLVMPMIDEATKALEIALKEVVYKPDEEQEAK